MASKPLVPSALPLPGELSTERSAGRPPKAAMLIAQRIVRDISKAGLTTGDRLPPEKAMLASYVTGRGTMREALRLLEFQGIVSLKPGPGGGPVIREPDPAALAPSLMLLLTMEHVPYSDVFDVQTCIEPTMTRLAVTRITPAGQNELSAAADAMRAALDDQLAFARAERAFHRTVARHCGNALFSYLLDSILAVLEATAPADTDSSRPLRIATLKLYDATVEAFTRREVERAGELMLECLEAVAEHAREYRPEVLARTVSWDQYLS